MANYTSEFSKFASGANLTTQVLEQLNNALDGYGRSLVETVKFVAAVGSRRIDNENVVCMSTVGLGYTRLCKELNEANIPHIAVANDKDGTVFVAIPKQYRDKAEMIAEKINKDASPTWVKHEELRRYDSPDLGGRPKAVVVTNSPFPKTVTFQNVPAEELEICKKELTGTHIAADIHERGDGSGSITVIAGGEKEALVRQALVGAKMYFAQENGFVLQKEVQNNLKARTITEKHIESIKAGKTVFISDKANKNVYRIDDRGIYVVADKGKSISEKPIIARENNVYKDQKTGKTIGEKEFKAEVYSAIADMTHPEAHTFTKTQDGQYQDISGHVRSEGAISNALIEESARYIAESARENANNGYVQLATDANHLIQALSKQGMEPGANQFNNRIEGIMSTLDDKTIAIGEDQYRMSPEELTAVLVLATNHPAVVDATKQELDEIVQQVGASPDGHALEEAIERIRNSQDLKQACIESLQRFQGAVYETESNKKVNTSSVPTNTKDRDNTPGRDDRVITNDDRDEEEREDDYPDVD